MKNIWKLFIGEEKNQTNMCQFRVNKTQQSSQTILRRTYWAGSVWLQEMTCFAFKPPRLSLLNGDPSCSLPTPFFFIHVLWKSSFMWFMVQNNPFFSHTRPQFINYAKEIILAALALRLLSFDWLPFANRRFEQVGGASLMTARTVHLKRLH